MSINNVPFLNEDLKTSIKNNQLASCFIKHLMKFNKTVKILTITQSILNFIWIAFIIKNKIHIHF